MPQGGPMMGKGGPMMGAPMMGGMMGGPRPMMGNPQMMGMMGNPQMMQQMQMMQKGGNPQMMAMMGGKGAPMMGGKPGAMPQMPGGPQARPPMPQQPQPAAQPAGQQPFNASTLAAAPPAVQKQMIGERLYPQIAKLNPEMAGKVTGMMLEMDNSELLMLLESESQLRHKVNEALQVLGGK